MELPALHKRLIMVDNVDGRFCKHQYKVTLLFDFNLFLCMYFLFVSLWSGDLCVLQNPLKTEELHTVSKIFRKEDSAGNL